MSFSQILEKYRHLAFSEHDKGGRFERLIQAYLLTDPYYAPQFKHVWLWQQFPGRDNLGGHDTGIDLVALTHKGEYWAIQCKFFQAEAHIDKPAVDSFLATSGREFKNEQGQTTRFTHRLWISTTNHWSSNAAEALKNQHPSVSRLGLTDLMEAPVDWDKLEQGLSGAAARSPQKTLFPHQQEALKQAHTYYQEQQRGKLIMACGTGKTFTSLRLAEQETNGQGLVLFLVPSIALLGQTLREWSSEAQKPLQAICICSDPAVSRKRSKLEDSDSFSVVDLALPASTDIPTIVQRFHQFKDNPAAGLTVVFSTYQSIEVIAQAQKALLQAGFSPFDLIICDEAHRTTGVTLAGADESAFVKVHDNQFIQAKKRLYMTATPRLYSDDTKSKADQAGAVLCSMDEPKLYGQEFYRIGFGEAVEKNLLTDYKVLILTLNDHNVPPAVQHMVANPEMEINTDDVSKLIGCINALSKQFVGDDGQTKATDPEPMRRAVAFCQSISASKQIARTYNAASDSYLDSLPPDKKKQMVSISAQHMDGTMSAPVRDELLTWLKAPSEANECRILTNVRVLSEGVDVPSLDAVLFLSAKNSQVDVVQSVGRVMRKSPGKKYGYIIIPVVVPADVEPEHALNDNERYKVVWTVLNALRAHDDRFNVIINKIELNKKRPVQILVGQPETSFAADGSPHLVHEPTTGYEAGLSLGQQLALQFSQLQSVIFARLVQKVGDRRYWEQWAKDVAQIAERQIERINYLIATQPEQKSSFDQFLTGLQKNINPSITHSQAVDMLAQHIITQPIFEALFEGYSFVKSNAVSTEMQKMLDLLAGESVVADSETLQRFYESVKKRAAGIDNAEGKQRIIIELYDKFFKTAFPKMVEQLGIVYTPVEVVDFIIHSVHDVLQQEFGRGIGDEGIHILDPFTGTGTFITRLLQSGLIHSANLRHKYENELHANEIVLLAYYIAAVNIENAYHDAAGEQNDYLSFPGIVLTDTFQLGETDNLFSEVFPQNSARAAEQKKAPLRVIMGNPPYSVGQKSGNDNAQNQRYSFLDSRVELTYARNSQATSVKALYDSYIKAFRWSSDRLDPQQGGIIAFVSNGAWLDSNGMDGFRKVLEKEFTSIWVFNLRGNQRTSGELSRREGGKIFGSGSRTPIAITLLVKNPAATHPQATIYYHDIGDYLNREEKLKMIQQLGSVTNPALDWQPLTPNEHGDWLGQRNNVFEASIPIESDKKFDLKTQAYFITNSLGLNSGRASWCYNSSIVEMSKNIQEMIEFYNQQRIAYAQAIASNPSLNLDDFIEYNPRKIIWNRGIKTDLQKNKPIYFNKENIQISSYRPFFKQYMYLARELNEMIYQIPKLFPSKENLNFVICVSGLGGTKDFSVLITDCVPDYQYQFNGQCFPLYYYEERPKQAPTLFAPQAGSEYIRRDGLTDFILDRAKKLYGGKVSKEDIFYYVYGFLHSPTYRTQFANDLKKMLPRLPLVEEAEAFWRFSAAGRQLAQLHLHYETVPHHPEVVVSGAESGHFLVEKMRFPQKDQKDTIIYNSHITLSNIPLQAYDYVVNGKSAIEWVMERYQITIHKESGLRNDPNDWAQEVGNPRYILDLLLSVINLSVQTVAIVHSLPEVSFE